MQTKSKIIISSLVITASLSFAGFAYAHLRPNNIVLNKASLDAAQKDEASCLKFKDDVFNWSQGRYKAVWTLMGDPNDTLPVQVCVVVESTFTEGGDPSKASLDSQYVTTAIMQSQNGITQADVQKAIEKSETTNNEASIWSKAAGLILSAVFKLMTFVVFNLTFLAGKILSIALSQGTFTDGKLPLSVHQGWVIVRDVFNMFFILVLIIMSLATILRREEYGYRKILLKLILIAIVINFSEVICVTLIQVADSLAMIFAKDARITDYGQTMLKILSPDNTKMGILTSSSGVQGDVIRAASGFILSLVMMSAYVAIALLIVIRFVGLYMLIVLAPAAFALYTFPATQKYFTMWRENFIKYTIWLPIAIFFMRLGNLFFQNNASANVFANNTAPDYSLLIIAGFYWGAFWVTKSSGVYGAQAVTNWSQGASKMLGTYLSRGTAFKRAGEFADAGLSKVTGRQITALQKPGKWMEKTTQFGAAVPAAVKEGFRIGNKQYNEGVGDYQNKMLKFVHMFDDDKTKWDADIAYRIYSDKVKNNKLTTNDIEAISDLKRKAVPGVFRALTALPAGNLKDEAQLAILHKLNAGEVADNQDIFNELPFGPIPANTSGFRYVDPSDPNKGIIFELESVSQNGNINHRTRRMNADTKAAELDFYTEGEQTKKVEKDLEAMKAKLDKTGKFYQAYKNDPNIEKKVIEAELKGDIYSTAEANRVNGILNAADGDGARIPVDKSLVSRSGQRVIINPEVAKSLEIGQDQDEYITKEYFEEFAKVLKDKGGVSDSDIEKMRNAANKMGGIAVQNGKFAALDSMTKDILSPERQAQVRSQFRSAQREEKTHERSHGFYSFVQNQSPADYSKMVSAVTSDPAFAAMKTTLIEKQGYKNANLPDTIIAEEILARPETRIKLSETTQGTVNSVLDTHKTKFIEKRNEVTKESKLIERQEKVRVRVEERVGAPSAALNAAASHMSKAADELSETTQGIKEATFDLSKTIKSATVPSRVSQDFEQTRASDRLRRAAEALTKGAETGAASANKLNQAAGRQEAAATATTTGADNLNKAADAINRFINKPPVPPRKPNVPRPPVGASQNTVNTNSEAPKDIDKNNLDKVA